MKKILYSILPLAMAATGASMASGDFGADGNALLKQCSTFTATGYTGDDSTDLGVTLKAANDSFCMGLVTGIVQVLGREQDFCMADDVQLGQTMRVVMLEIQKHPNLFHHDAASLVEAALKDAFSCLPKDERADPWELLETVDRLAVRATRQNLVE